MKTTIEIPDAILERTKVAAARRRTSMKKLMIQGFEMVLQEEPVAAPPAEALVRLREGYHLGGIQQRGQALNLDISARVMSHERGRSCAS